MLNGLLPRAKIKGFTDVADPEIIANRSRLQLEHYVPFHWFSRNPFDGRVQEDLSAQCWVLISVKRTLAQAENWHVVPRHPLASEDLQLLSYTQGVEQIDWDTMNKRDYHDPYCKSVCMAECLSPGTVHPDKFFKLYVKNDTVAAMANEILKDTAVRPGLDVVINSCMFL